MHVSNVLYREWGRMMRDFYVRRNMKQFRNISHFAGIITDHIGFRYPIRKVAEFYLTVYCTVFCIASTGTGSVERSGPFLTRSGPDPYPVSSKQQTTDLKK
jgi:hypothetical protein